MSPSMKLDLWQRVFSQVQGVDYDEFFPSVAMLKSVGIMLALAAFFDYEIWQMDVKTTFLNGFLMTHNYRGSIVVLSISKSVEPNEELKVEQIFPQVLSTTDTTLRTLTFASN